MPEMGHPTCMEHSIQLAKSWKGRVHGVESMNKLTDKELGKKGTDNWDRDIVGVVFSMNCRKGRGQKYSIVELPCGLRAR